MAEVDQKLFERELRSTKTCPVCGETLTNDEIGEVCPSCGSIPDDVMNDIIQLATASGPH
jgi:rubrerythrin